MVELPKVTVVFASAAGHETCLSIRLEAGFSVADAVRASGIASLYPAIDFDVAQVGIWGRPARLDALLAADDRIEIYRSLTVDPKSARARRAEKKRRSTGLRS